MFQVSIDTGGTFIDGLLMREDGTVSVAKVATTPNDLSQGIMDCIESLAKSEEGVSSKNLLANTAEVIIGINFAQEVIFQHKGAKVGMITTKGFRDILEMRRIPKIKVADLHLPKPVILVPRYLRLGVEERTKYTGEIITKLNEKEVRKAADKLNAQGVEIIAICFMQSCVNPAHEKRAAEIIREVYPDTEVVLSSTLPYPMEFERFNTAVLAAYIAPPCKAYLRKLEDRLRAAGFKGAMLAAISSSGVTALKTAMEYPILTLSSGPSAVCLLAGYLGKQLGFENVISADMGGTSFDISIIPEGRILTTTDGIIADQRNTTETVDIVNVGTGGGTIARLDMRGLLTLGPESAGANPGPVCYGKGGQRPTITDADVVLGYIPADYFLGGRIKLDVTLARKAIKELIADPQGIDTSEAAYTIHSLVCGTVGGSISLASIKHGYDASSLVLCAAGGISPGYIFDLAKSLRIKEVYVPKTSSVSGALGMMYADFKHQVNQFVRALVRDVDLKELSNLYRKMEKEQIALLKKEGVEASAIRIRRGASIQYYGQIWGIDAEMPEIGIDKPVTAESFNALVEGFYKTYETRYGHVNRNIPIQIAGIKSVLVGARPKNKMVEYPRSSEDASKAFKRKRSVYFPKLEGFVETPCYDGDRLQHGNVIAGPAIIEEKTTTVVILQDAKVSVDCYGNYYGMME